MIKLLKIILLILIVTISSCGDDTIVQNGGGNNEAGEIFYIKLYQPLQTLNAGTYTMNANGTSNKLFKDSLWVSSTSYRGKVALGLIGGFHYAGLYLTNTDGTTTIQIPQNNLLPVYYILSPAGDKVLFTTDDGNYLCVVNADGTNFLQLSTGISGNETAPHFSPDGNLIAYYESVPGTSKGLYTIKTDGTGKTLLKDSVNNVVGSVLDWSPDGNKIVFENSDPFSNICTINKDGSGYTVLAEGIIPVWSPDGSKICFMKHSNQATELSLMNSDGSNQTNITNTNLEYENSPRWSPDSKMILFSNQLSSETPNLRIYDLTSMTTIQIADSAAAGFWKYP